MKAVGNAQANRLWEANIPPSYQKPVPKDERYPWRHTNDSHFNPERRRNDSSKPNM